MGLEEIEIPEIAFTEFAPKGKSVPPVVPIVGETPEAKAAREETERLAAASGETAEEKLAREAVEKANLKAPDLSLLEGADKDLLDKLAVVGQKEEAELTVEEKKFVEDNLELMRALANQEVSSVMALMGDEGFIEEGEYADDLDGYKSYLTARDQKRDQTVVESYLTDNPEVGKLAAHLKENKPLITYLAAVQKPEILSTKLAAITETMTDPEKENLNGVYENVITAHLRSTGMTDPIIKSVVEGIKTNGSLFTMAQEGLKSMNNTYDANIKAENDRTASDKLILDQRDQEDEKKIVAAVKTGKLTPNILVPKADEAAFISYLTKSVNDRGDTMADVKYSKLSLEERAALDYIVYKDMKIASAPKTNVLSKYKIGKQKNDGRKTSTTLSSATGSVFQKLDLKAAAKKMNAI